MRRPSINATACAALLLLCLRAAPALAAAPDVLLADQTWTELRDQIRAGKTTIIIPVGGTEQSGPYVALGKHNARALALSQQIARGLGNAFARNLFDQLGQDRHDDPEPDHIKQNGDKNTGKGQSGAGLGFHTVVLDSLGCRAVDTRHVAKASAIEQ